MWLSGNERHLIVLMPTGSFGALGMLGAKISLKSAHLCCMAEGLGEGKSFDNSCGLRVDNRQCF